MHNGLKDSTGVLALLVVLHNCIVGVMSMEGGGDPVLDNEPNANLAYYPPSVGHKYNCADHGIWTGSCDIDLQASTEMTEQAPTVYKLADWSESCDPWKGVTETFTLNYDADNMLWVDKSGTVKTDWDGGGNWTCPEQFRSISGCGDFRTDTRGIKCDAALNLFNCGRPLNADRRNYDLAESSMDGPQRHTCIQHPIFYTNMNTEAPVIPPAMGRHRERWAKYGEYEFLPPQRWMHNNEHGGAIFLYHECLDEESKCALRRYIQKWEAKIGSVPWSGHQNDKFRFILTPFKNLATPMAIVMWGHVYSSKCFNQQDMDYFITKHYRQGFEDWPPSGAYNHSWKDIGIVAEESGCDVLPPTEDPHPEYMRSVPLEDAMESEKMYTRQSGSDYTAMLALDTASNDGRKCQSSGPGAISMCAPGGVFVNGKEISPGVPCNNSRIEELETEVANLKTLLAGLLCKEMEKKTCKKDAGSICKWNKHRGCVPV